MRVGVGVAVAEGEVAVAAGLWRLLQLRCAARRRMGRRLVTVKLDCDLAGHIAGWPTLEPLAMPLVLRLRLSAA